MSTDSGQQVNIDARTEAAKKLLDEVMALSQEVRQAHGRGQQHLTAIRELMANFEHQLVLNEQMGNEPSVSQSDSIKRKLKGYVRITELMYITKAQTEVIGRQLYKTSLTELEPSSATEDEKYTRLMDECKKLAASVGREGEYVKKWDDFEKIRKHSGPAAAIEAIQPLKRELQALEAINHQAHCKCRFFKDEIERLLKEMKWLVSKVRLEDWRKAIENIDKNHAHTARSACAKDVLDRVREEMRVCLAAKARVTESWDRVTQLMGENAQQLQNNAVVTTLHAVIAKLVADHDYLAAELPAQRLLQRLNDLLSDSRSSPPEDDAAELQSEIVAITQVVRSKIDKLTANVGLAVKVPLVDVRIIDAKRKSLSQFEEGSSGMPPLNVFRYVTELQSEIDSLVAQADLKVKEWQALDKLIRRGLEANATDSKLHSGRYESILEEFKRNRSMDITLADMRLLVGALRVPFELSEAGTAITL